MTPIVDAQSGELLGSCSSSTIKLDVPFPAIAEEGAQESGADAGGGLHAASNPQPATRTKYDDLVASAVISAGNSIWRSARRGARESRSRRC